MVRFTFILVFFCALIECQAQYRQPSSRPSNNFSDKIYFGGGGGFGGGNQFLSISASPLVGYKVTDQFSAGMQITYQYNRFAGYSASNYGGGPFALYAFSQKIFAYSQYEYLSVQPLIISQGQANRYNFRSLFVGMGYNEPLGGVVSLQLTALYNLLHGDGTKSPYETPWQFRVGLVAGF
ncbi:MAG: hypothetical protein ACI83W_001467 [Marinoscillum sp.]|jgi:hypothetical protein